MLSSWNWKRNLVVLGYIWKWNWKKCFNYYGCYYTLLFLLTIDAEGNILGQTNFGVLVKAVGCGFGQTNLGGSVGRSIGLFSNVY